jgi:hypothetical protein
MAMIRSLSSFSRRMAVAMFGDNHCITGCGVEVSAEEVLASNLDWANERVSKSAQFINC